MQRFDLKMHGFVKIPLALALICSTLLFPVSSIPIPSFLTHIASGGLEKVDAKYSALPRQCYHGSGEEQRRHEQICRRGFLFKPNESQEGVGVESRQIINTVSSDDSTQMPETSDEASGK